MTSVDRPDPDEYDPFYAPYLSLVPETDVMPVLESQPSDLHRLADRVAPERETYRYQPDKWSIREVFGHLTDVERMLGHRAFRISRGESAPLPGFNEDQYVARADFDRRALDELAREFSLVREGNLGVLRPLTAAQWNARGVANDAPVSVRALAFIIAGHVRHHLRLLRSRYGVA